MAFEIGDIVKYGRTYWRVTQIWDIYELEEVCPRGSAWSGEHRQVRSLDGGKTFEEWRGFANINENIEWTGTPWRHYSKYPLAVKVANSKGKPLVDSREYQLQGDVTKVTKYELNAKLEEYAASVRDSEMSIIDVECKLLSLGYSDRITAVILAELEYHVGKGYGVTAVNRGKITLKNGMFTIGLKY